MDWRGPTGFALALCVGLGFLSAMVAVSFFQDAAISEQGAGLLNTMGGAIIGGVVVWLGGFGSQNQRPYEPPQQQDRKRETTTMSTTTPEPQDPALNPDRKLEDQPQDAPGTEQEPEQR